MPKKNVIAIDYSASTCFSNNREYWPRVSKHLKNLNDKDSSYIFWDNRQNPILMNQENALKEAEEANNQRCRGGTNPSSFIQYLTSHKEGINLTIFTDGQVDESCVNNCDALLKDKEIKIKQLKVFFIGPKNGMNLSVSAPFTRAERLPDTGMDCVIHINDEKPQHYNSVHLSSTLKKYFGEPELFLEELPNFLGALKLQNLGRKNEDENFRAEIIKLKNNLLKVIAESAKSSDIKIIQNELMQSLINKDEKSALDKVESLIKTLDSHTEFGKKIEAGFQEILTVFDKKSDFSFDACTSNRIIRASEVKETSIETLHDIQDDFKFECPITLEEDLPVLYIKNCYQIDKQTNKTIKKYQPILAELEKKDQDRFINNPLAILDDAALVAKIKARFDKVYGFNATQKLYKKDQVFTSPYTREKISSIISVPTIDEESHKKARNYALADLFFGGKLSGVPELWLAVVYFVAKNTGHLTTEDNFDGFSYAFKESLINQLKNKHTYMALSGLSEDGPLIKVPIALAVWYCMVSPKLDSVPNRLSVIGTPHHLNLLDELGFPYDRKWTLHQLAIYQIFAEMLKQSKQKPKKLNKWIRSLYQNSMVVDNTIIMLDGRSEHDPKSIRISLDNIKTHTHCLIDNDIHHDDGLITLSMGEILTLYQWADPSRTLGDISIPNDVWELAIPDATINYNAQENEQSGYTVVCPFTLRPYSHDLVSDKPWQEMAEERFGPLSGQVSIYNYFVRYVTEQEVIPSKERFIIWLEEKQSQRSDAKDTLPKTIQIDVDNAFNSFTSSIIQLFSAEYTVQASNLFESYATEKEKINSVLEKNCFGLIDMPVELFKKITEFSRNKQKRLELESVYKAILKAESSTKKIIHASGFFTNKQNNSNPTPENSLPDEQTIFLKLGQC